MKITQIQIELFGLSAIITTKTREIRYFIEKKDSEFCLYVQRRRCLAKKWRKQTLVEKSDIPLIIEYSDLCELGIQILKKV